MKLSRYYLTLLALSLLAGCTEPPNYPTEPRIEYIGVSKKTIVQGSRNAVPDTLFIRFSFTDGDGDLGDRDSINIFLTDSRDGFRTTKKINPIPEQGSGNGVSGEITLRLVNAVGDICCIFPDRRVCQVDPRYPQDTFSYSIQMRDRAGNLSNIIQTEPITILCQ